MRFDVGDGDIPSQSKSSDPDLIKVSIDTKMLKSVINISSAGLTLRKGNLEKISDKRNELLAILLPIIKDMPFRAGVGWELRVVNTTIQRSVPKAVTIASIIDTMHTKGVKNTVKGKTTKHRYPEETGSSLAGCGKELAEEKTAQKLQGR